MTNDAPDQRTSAAQSPKCLTCAGSSDADDTETQVADAGPLYGHTWYSGPNGSFAVPFGYKGPLPAGSSPIPGQVPRIGMPIYPVPG